MKLGEFTAKYISSVPTIAECHATRLGWTRTLLGGCSMYLSIPVWILIHLTTTTSLYWLLRRFLKLDPMDMDDYVIIDRHRISGLAFFDRINCNFCGYANGLTVMLNEGIDRISRKNTSLSFLMIIPIYLLVSVFTLISVVADFVGIHLVFDSLVAPQLDMKKTGEIATLNELYESDYARGYNKFNRMIILYNKNVFIRFSKLLKEIESSWCPLTHLKKTESVKYPEHHQNFFAPNELAQMREVLISKGSVTKDRKDESL